MPVTWNEQMNAKLFVQVLAVHNISALNFKAVADGMASGVSAKALQHQVAKLKALAAGPEPESQRIAGSVASTGTTPVKTPRRKPAKATIAEEPKTPRKKAAKTITATATPKCKKRTADGKIKDEQVTGVVARIKDDDVLDDGDWYNDEGSDLEGLPLGKRVKIDKEGKVVLTEEDNDSDEE